jgi:hypothetical protein
MKINLLNHNSGTKQSDQQKEFHFVNAKHYKQETKRILSSKSAIYTTFLYIISIVSIAAWLVSLVTLPFGDLFQFVLGAIVLSINLLVFKWAKV